MVGGRGKEKYYQFIQENLAGLKINETEVTVTISYFKTQKRANVKMTILFLSLYKYILPQKSMLFEMNIIWCGYVLTTTFFFEMIMNFLLDYLQSLAPVFLLQVCGIKHSSKFSLGFAIRI